jgi:NitT/TauT family transport system substrate-binding protein
MTETHLILRSARQGASRRTQGRFAALILALALIPLGARAEVAEVALAQQFGISFMPLMLMEHDRLIEKEAVRLGLPEPKVTWAKVAGPSVMNDGLLSGALHFVSTGVPSLGLLWDRTKSGVGVKGLSAICSYPLNLNTRNEAVKSIRDFGETDRIAVPSVKVSTQAILLQMEAEKIFGPGKHTAIDHLTVSLAHPDAMASLLNPTSQVTAHFASSPFHEAEIKDKKIHTVLNSYEILGGQATALVLLTTERFRTANPKTTQAVMAALKDAIDRVNADKADAARRYKEMSGDKTPVEEIHAMMADPGFNYTLTPQKVGVTVQFQHRIGSVKSPVASWQELFFPEAHDLPGD